MKKPPPPRTRPRPRRGARPTPAWLVRACLAAPFAGLLALLWTLRAAPVGVPVADDYDFLAALAFQHPLDPFGSMNAVYYWRPLSRQLWFSLVGPWLVSAPWLAPALHVLLLCALAFVLARLARRVAPLEVAALVATVPLLAEPARVLVAWPSGSQHLLGALFLALALHESLAARRWTAALAALAAALSHEFGAVAFPLVLAGAWARGGARTALRESPWALVPAALWLAGYRVALAGGVRLPAGGHAWAAVPDAARMVAQSGLNIETLPSTTLMIFTVAAFALLATAALSILLAPGRPRLAGAWRGAALAAGVALVGLPALASLLPDWNAWRAFTPMVAATTGVVLLVSCAHPALGLALAALRLATLTAASPAMEVGGAPPATVSDVSFVRLARMQRLAEVTGAIVRSRPLPPGAVVRYWGLPQMSMVGLADGLAVRVWLRDSAVRFVAMDGRPESTWTNRLVVAYDMRPGHTLAMRVAPEAIEALAAGMRADSRNEMTRADSCYRAALAAQTPVAPSLAATALHSLSYNALERDQVDMADSLNELSERVRPNDPAGEAIRAVVALRRGDVRKARERANLCLKFDPSNGVAKWVLQQIQGAASRPPGAAPGR